MLNSIKPEQLLFLDIETVPEVQSFSELPEKKQILWDKKSVYFRKEESPNEVYQRAGIYAEFGKIICISVGMTFLKNEERNIRLHSYYGDDEGNILHEVIDLFNKLSKTPEILLCAHNGKEFDFPYMARRILINGLSLPLMLDVAGKNPGRFPFLIPWNSGSLVIINIIYPWNY